MDSILLSVEGIRIEEFLHIEYLDGRGSHPKDV